MLRGHGCPNNAAKNLCDSISRTGCVAAWPARIAGRVALKRISMALMLIFFSANASSAAENVECELRFVWGSSTPRSFAGQISVETGILRVVRNLSLQADSIGNVRSPRSNELQISPHSPSTFGGLDIAINAPLDARVSVRAKDTQTGEVTQHDATVEQLLSGTWIKPLDKDGGRIAFERQVYDRLRVDLGREQTIFRPGETLSMKVSGNKMGLDAGSYTLAVGYQSKKPIENKRVTIDDRGNFPTTQFSVTAPASDGAHLLSVSLTRDHLLSSVISPSPVLVRRVDLVCLDDTKQAGSIAGWKPLAEIDAYMASQPGTLAWLAPEELRRALPMQTMSEVASMWSYINPLAGSFTTPKTIGELGSRALAGSLASESGGAAACLTLSPGASVTVPLGQLKPGIPHRLSVTYPPDQPMHLAVTVRPQSESGRQQSIDSAIQLEPIACSMTDGAAIHEVVFWPENATSSVTLFNPHAHWKASVKTILVSAAEHQQTPDHAKNNSRHTGVYLSQPIIVDAMATQRDVDPSNGRRYEGWRTWYTALTRLGQYMSWMEADTLYVNVFSSGGGILVNDGLSPTLRFDSGTFFSDGRSPEQKDVVELLLRMADRDRRRVVLLLNLDSQLPGLAGVGEGAESVVQQAIDPSEQNTSDKAQQYNPLDARVQESIRGALKKIVSRYGNHRSMAGIGIELGRKSHLAFRGDRWGYSPGNLRAFEKDAGGKLSDTASAVDVFAQDAIRSSYLNWRAGQVAKLYQELTQIARTASPKAKLYLNPSRLWQTRPTSDEFYDPSAALRSPSTLLLGCGLDVAQLASIDGLELISAGRPRSDNSVSSAEWMLDLASSQCLSHLPESAKQSSIVQTPSTSIQLVNEGDPNGVTSTIYPALTASGRHAVKDLISSIYDGDRTELTTGSWAPRQGDTQLQREVFSTLRAFPPTTLNLSPTDGPSNIRIRQGSHSNKTYVQIVNSAPWQEQVVITLQHAVDANIRELGISPSRLTIDTSSRRQDVQTWTIEVRPFDLVGVEIDSPDVSIMSVDHSSPPQTTEHIAGELSKVEAVVTRAGDPTQQRPMVDLGGDFERWNSSDAPLGWTLSSLPQVSLDRSAELPHSGRSSLAITNRGRADTSAWIQSSPLAPPSTGRFLVSTWLRASAAADPTLVRISVSGRLTNGEAYERSTLVGGRSPLGKRLPIDWGQRPFQLHVNDLPLEQLDSMRVAVELIGSGRIWVDDVEVYALELMPEEWRHLRGQILVAQDQLREGNPYPAYQLLESHWGQYAARLNRQPSGGEMTPVQERTERSAASWNNSTPAFEKWRENMRGRWQK